MNTGWRPCEDGLRKILNGETTVAEVCRVTTEEAVLD